MGITLDGIAKGYIVDRMADVLLQNGVPNFLINAGGDIRTAGTKGNGFPWTVAVQDPSKEGEFPDVMQMTDGAVATSGSYERRYGHIVDSGLAESPEHNTSVTVSAPTSMTADAMATALFVMKPDDGLRLIGTLPGNECLIVDNRGEQRRSVGWNSAKCASREAGELW
jgi:thiamine biosynthesis lipoprotein